MKRVWLIVVLFAFALSFPAAAQENITIHVVQRGETLYRIAQEYGVTVHDLALMNGIVNSGNIRVGQRILVPNGEVPEATVPLSHTVQAGETLQSIANFYHVSIDELVAMNEISNPSAIYVGQVLRLVPDENAIPEPTEAPSEQATEAPPPTTAAETAPAATEVPTDTAPIQNLVHIVKRGETLYRIAQEYGLTVNDFVAANNIPDARFIYAGQELIVPGFEIQDTALDLPPLFSGVNVAAAPQVEGRTVRVQVTTTQPSTMTGTFLDRDLHVGTDADQLVHTVLQGIPRFTSPGIYPLHLSATENATGAVSEFDLQLQIIAGPYGRETIQLMAGRESLLDPTLEANEEAMVASVMSQFTDTRYFSGPMSLPAAATIISPYGSARSYDGGPFDHFHSGTDFAGAPGTPILAAAPGRVVLVDTLNVRGNATIIDHGWGVFTGYWHQTEQYVQVGDFVNTGDVIGTIGGTGRVTGPHLHWELWVGGVPVDPMDWVRNSFS